MFGESKALNEDSKRESKGIGVLLEHTREVLVEIDRELELWCVT